MKNFFVLNWVSRAEEDIKLEFQKSKKGGETPKTDPKDTKTDPKDTKKGGETPKK